MGSTSPSSLRVEYGARIDSGFIRNIFCTPDQEDNFRRRYNNTDVYQSAFLYDSRDIDEASLVGDAYFDFDTELNNEEAFSKVRQDALSSLMALKIWYGIPTDMVHIYFSGCKGIHITVPQVIFDIQPDRELHLKYKELATKLSARCKYKTLDLKIYDRRRLFRLTNSIHRKTGLYKIPITYEELQGLSYAQILELAKSPRSITYTTPRTIRLAVLGLKQLNSLRRVPRKIKADFSQYKGKEFWPPCITYMLEQPVTIGSRNNIGCVIAAYMYHHGYTEEETKDIIITWGNTVCMPQLSQEEIESILVSMRKGGYNYGCETIKSLCPCACKDKECGMKRNSKV